MNVKSAEKVCQIIESTDTVERDRSDNRAKISRLVNGFPPVDKSTAKKLGLDILFNGLDATVLNRQANLQYSNAFQSKNQFFNLVIPSCPVEKQAEWPRLLTEFINTPMKESRGYAHLLDEKFASVVMHGIGPQFWMSKDAWLADSVALADLRVATDTNTSLSNLVWIARKVRYTTGELAVRVFGKYAAKGWNRTVIQSILKKYQNKNWENQDYDWANEPEKMSALIKQNMAFYTSDAVPTINLWHFYHLDQTDPIRKCVMMKVVPDRSVDGATRTEFLFESDKPVAERLEHLLHVQFGDLNGDPPFKWHSVRSLGYMLHEPAFWMSLTRCRGLQHLWENFQMLMQSSTPLDKGRTQKVELFKGWLPNDVRIIPQAERHQIDSRLLQFFMSQMKQMMGESASAYTQNPDTGTQKERTAFEVSAVIQTANQLLSGLLNIAFRNEVFAYREICRRFCNKKSIDPDVREFWKKVTRAKIPVQYINERLWTIEPEIPLGSGNQGLELAAATQLMSVRGAHNPEAQSIILNMYDAAVSRNARLAQRLAPVGERLGITDAQRDAEAMFGTLMVGGEVKPREGLNPIDQIDSMFMQAQQVVTRIESTGNMATMQEAAGLANVIQYITELISLIAQDEQQKERVTAYMKMMGKLQNDLKGFTQRLVQENAKNGQNGNGEAAAKVQAMLLQAQTKAEIDKAKAANKEKMKQVGFELAEMRKNIEMMANADREKAMAGQEMLLKRMQTIQDMTLKGDEEQASEQN